MDKRPQVKSRKRVADHGEVFTNIREVNAMLDLVKHETERIESRFLEPACGTGNFLSEILRRKLNVVQARYQSSQFEFEFNSIIAISSIYGIDIMEDNVVECRKRLFDIFNEEYYQKLYTDSCKQACKDSAQYILSLNIVWGDALTMKTISDPDEAIMFPEWTPINGNQVQRRDFSYDMLVSEFTSSAEDELDVFGMISDMGQETYNPQPEKVYLPTHFLELQNVKLEL